MERKSPWTWADMIAEFRALGGVAENVRPGLGQRRRGLFPIDPGRDVRINVPPRLLIDVRDVVLDGDRLAIRPGSTVDPGVSAFFERYEEGFSFGAGAAEECRRSLTAMYELPDEVRAHLRLGAPPGRVQFVAPTRERVFGEYLRTRKISFGSVGQDREVLMPILDLVNHAGDRQPFSWVDGASLAGRFPEEVVARYITRDAWDGFLTYRFATLAPVAFSRTVDLRTPAGQRVSVRDDLTRFRRIDGITVPEVERQGGTLVIWHLMLGNRTAPGFSRWVFRRIMREAGVSKPDELFDVIAHMNWSWFLELLALLENCGGPMIEEMRKAVRLQLETMSFCVGAELGGVALPIPNRRPVSEPRLSGLGAALAREPRLPGRRR